MDLNITPKQLILVLAGWAFALSAAAQYQWIGKDGRKVFSDRPPPADIQEKDILKQPGGRRAPCPWRLPSPPTPPDAPQQRPQRLQKPRRTANAPKLSGKDAELEARRKSLRKKPRPKKKAEEEKVAQAQADNCERAKKAVTIVPVRRARGHDQCQG